MQLLTKKSILSLFIFASIFQLVACSANTPTSTSPSIETIPTIQITETIIATTPIPTETTNPSPTSTIAPSEIASASPTTAEADKNCISADVVSVTANGTENAYNFAVEIRSPDTGCEQYADWWEVVTEDGELIYRRILAHSHTNEQPFTRSGGPVMIGPETVVIVRAHMHPTGYGGAAFRGSVFGHFEEIKLEAGFAPELKNIDPLPEGCAF